ncbi:MAG: hypothetical protein Q7W13_00185 [Bacteroidia bacterium]|nr:hypothetical protein [Bacteroidia bacterium]
MKNRFQIKSFIIATFFLVAYLNVFAKQASCNLPHIFELSTKSTPHDDGHDHHHGNEEAPAHHHDDESNDQQDKKNKKDDNCCNDKTSIFFESQGNPIVSSFDFKNVSCTELVFIKAVFIYNPLVFDIKNYASYSLPPPKIPDIRVFIQSFII